MTDPSGLGKLPTNAGRAREILEKAEIEFEGGEKGRVD